MEEKQKLLHQNHMNNLDCLFAFFLILQRWISDHLDVKLTH